MTHKQEHATHKHAIREALIKARREQLGMYGARMVG